MVTFLIEKTNRTRTWTEPTSTVHDSYKFAEIPLYTRMLGDNEDSRYIG